MEWSQRLITGDTPIADFHSIRVEADALYGAIHREAQALMK